MANTDPQNAVDPPPEGASQESDASPTSAAGKRRWWQSAPKAIEGEVVGQNLPPPPPPTGIRGLWYAIKETLSEWHIRWLRLKRLVPPKQDGPVIDPLVIEYQPDLIELDKQQLPREVGYTLHTMVFMVFAFLLWASLSHVDRVVTGQGRLITTARTIVAQPLTTAVIRSIDVELGQVVKEGQLLAHLDPTFTEANLSQMRQRSGQLASRLRRLEAELSQQPFVLLDESSEVEKLEKRIFEERLAEYNARNAHFTQNLSRIKAAIRTNQEQRRDLQKVLEVMNEGEKIRTDLYDKQVGSKVLLLEAKSRRLSVANDIQRLENQEQESLHELGGVKSEFEAFITKWQGDAARELADTRKEYDGVTAELAKAERLSTLSDLRSPAHAVVLEIAQRSVGSVLREAETLITLVPVGDINEAEAEVSSQEIGRIRVGDTVRMKLDTYPFQRHGTLNGEVRTISEDAFKKDTPGGGSVSVYRVRIKITANELHDIPAQSPLLPGMTIQAEIKVGTRTIISYLLYPIIRALDEGLREP